MQVLRWRAQDEECSDLRLYNFCGVRGISLETVLLPTLTGQETLQIIFHPLNSGLRKSLKKPESSHSQHSIPTALKTLTKGILQELPLDVILVQECGILFCCMDDSLREMMENGRLPDWWEMVKEQVQGYYGQLIGGRQSKRVQPIARGLEVSTEVALVKQCLTTFCRDE